MMDLNFLTMFCSLATFADKRHVAPKLSHTNVVALNYLLRSEIFVSEDKQLRAIHLILDFQPISEICQDVSNAIRAGDPRLACIDVSCPSFLAWDDLSPITLRLQEILPKVVAASDEEIDSSHLSLEEEIDKFHFEEEKNLEALIVSISDVEGETNRHSSVHFSTLVIARPDNSSKEEEKKMALNKGNKSLMELMVAWNKVSTSKEATQSQVPPTLPPLPPPLSADLKLKAIPDLKKKMPVQELEKGEVGPQKRAKQQKVAKEGSGYSKQPMTPLNFNVKLCFCSSPTFLLKWFFYCFCASCLTNFCSRGMGSRRS